MSEVLTYAYAADIVKSERDEAGDLLVYGKATGPDKDLDGQRCDPAWLKTAMPAWFEWGNIRLMHQPVVAGVGVALTNDGDDWFVKSKVVDDATARKIEAGALKGYSIGVKSALIETRAGQEWVAGGNICEISYVDRPCLPTAKMMICKMASADSTLQPVEAPAADAPVVETPKDLAMRLGKAAQTDRLGKAAEETATPDRDSPEPNPASPPTDPLPEPEPELTKRTFTAAERHAAARSGAAMDDGSFPARTAGDLRNLIRLVGRSRDPEKAKAHIKARAKKLGKEHLIPDHWKTSDPVLTKDTDPQNTTHDPATIGAVRDGLVALINAELGELCDGDPELFDIEQLLYSLRLLMTWWSHEAAGGETTSPYTPSDDQEVMVTLTAEPEVVKASAPPEITEPSTETTTTQASVDEDRFAALVKSALADAKKELTEAAEERNTALVAELDTVKADLAKALALPEPGGPVITRTATQAAIAKQSDAQRLRQEAETLLEKAADVSRTDRRLAQGWEERAQQLLLKAAI